MKKWEKKRIIKQMLHMEEILTDTPQFVEIQFVIELQQEIISCGNYCERGGANKVVGLLEVAAEYCYICVERQQVKYYRYIGKKIKEARNLLDEEREEKTEILFMPYNAAMWGTMRSIYEYALKDKEVCVKVMPVPYRTKGEYSVVSYEKEYFKELEGFIKYEDYNLAENKPDMIIIHNPYDQYNSATTIVEQFYSTELIKYTEHLVYLPYDLVKEDEVNEHMCIMPGVTNAWKVIVQSEAVRKKYIKYNLKHKVVAIGSPKVDFLLNKEEFLKIPEEWKKKIIGRKIILWNLHMSRALYDISENIQKIKDIFEFFIKKDMLLLFRPHPLFKEKLHNQTAEKYCEYIKIIEKYKNSFNVIVDETEDFERAVLLSDGYIGDRGSLEVLFGMTGKPMLFFDGNIYLYNDRLWDTFLCFNFFIEKNNAWFFINTINLLIKVDLLEQKTEYVTSFAEMNAERCLIDSVVKIRDKIVLIPAYSNFIIIYNLKNGIINKIALTKQTKKYRYQICSVTSDEYIIVSPVEYFRDGILKINVVEEVIEEISISRTVLNEIEVLEDEFLLDKGVVVGETAYIPFQNKPYLLKCTNGHTEYVKVGVDGDGFVSCVYDGQDFWLLYSNKLKIIRWNESVNTVTEYDNFPKELITKGKIPFRQMLISNSVLWLIPYNANMILKMNIETMQMHSILCENSLIQKLFQEGKAFEGAFLTKERLYMKPSEHNALVELTLSTEKFRWIKIENILSDGRIKVVDKDFNYLSRNTSLEQFYEIISKNADVYKEKRKKRYSNYVNNFGNNCGQFIFEYLKDSYIKGL